MSDEPTPTLADRLGNVRCIQHPKEGSCLACLIAEAAEALREAEAKIEKYRVSRANWIGCADERAVERDELTAAVREAVTTRVGTEEHRQAQMALRKMVER